jgi:dephospho-CoA kinase
MTPKPWKLGLTGSIGMGKSTTAAMFAHEGVPVWDADAAVHRLYAEGGGGVVQIAALVPDATLNRSVDRDALRGAIMRDATLLPKIEAAIHPLVAGDQAGFLNKHASAPIVLFDIPLLFETGADQWLDSIVVVSAPPDIQRARVLSRPGMTETDFERILARQLPDTEKRARADHIIETGEGPEAARRAVRGVLSAIRNRSGQNSDA